MQFIAPMSGPAVLVPWGRLLFQPMWQDGSKLPTPLMKLTTQSWHSLSEPSWGSLTTSANKLPCARARRSVVRSAVLSLP